MFTCRKSLFVFGFPVPFFCFLSFCFSPCDPAIRCHRMMCIVRFPRSTIAAAVVVVVVVVVGVVGPRLCRGSKVRYLSEQGHVVVVVVGCSTFKHHPTPTSYIKKTPNIIASLPGPAASTSFRHETQDNTHMRPLCAIGAKHAKIAVCDCPATKQEARQCEETETKGKKSHVAHLALASSYPS